VLPNGSQAGRREHAVVMTPGRRPGPRWQRWLPSTARSTLVCQLDGRGAEIAPASSYWLPSVTSRAIHDQVRPSWTFGDRARDFGQLRTQANRRLERLGHHEETIATPKIRSEGMTKEGFMQEGVALRGGFAAPRLHPDWANATPSGTVIQGDVDRQRMVD